MTGLSRGLRLLGIRNGHDANLTYCDGPKVLYHKLERNLQKKHFEFLLGDDLPDDMPRLLRYAKEKMGVDFSTLDAVCVNPSSDRHHVPSPEPYEVVRKINLGSKDPDDQFWLDTFSCPVWVIDHHYAHVLSCWPLWEQKPGVNFVFDGIGDYSRNVSVFQDDTLVQAVHLKESPGLSVMFEHWGEQLKMEGMKIDLSGKVMAKAAYHTLPEEIEKIILQRSGYFGYHQLGFLKARCDEFIDHFRNCEEGIVNSAHILQEWCKLKIPELMRLYYPGRDKDWDCYFEPITYSGGTAQNTVVNTVIKDRFPNVLIPPHCPDDGISLGCVEFLREKYEGDPFSKEGFPFWQGDEAPLKRPSYPTIWRTVEALASGKIVGWYQGHGEIGPRALGNRSILMDPTLKDGKERLNERVKHREPYRPFGCSILNTKAKGVFGVSHDSPFMLFVIPLGNQSGQITTSYPAVTHVDGTCRIQTVDGNDPAFHDYYALLEAYHKLTGVPMLLNTSLNVNGKPIAGHIKDAKELFENSELDMLVVGDEIWDKKKTEQKLQNRKKSSNKSRESLTVSGK